MQIGSFTILAWHIWILVGIILGIMEIIIPGFFLFIFGLGCVAAGVAAVWLSLPFQIVIFIVATLVGFFAFRKVLYGKKAEEGETFGIHALVGKEGVVQEEVTEDSGYVKVGGEKWPARIQGSETAIPNGVRVTVKGFEGNRLIISTDKS